MISRRDIREFGLSKLAESSGGFISPDIIGQTAAAPGKALGAIASGVNPMSVPSPQESEDMNGYLRSAIVGGLSGTAISAILAAMLKRPMVSSLGLGLGTGAVAGLARRYDQMSDPPGLSPVYTIPAGMRMGALTGAMAGAPLGKLLGRGYIPGALGGALAGAIGGGAVSTFY